MQAWLPITVLVVFVAAVVWRAVTHKQRLGDTTLTAVPVALPPAGLVVTDVQIPFGRIVELLFAWTFAAALVWLVFAAVLGIVAMAFQRFAAW